MSVWVALLQPPQVAAAVGDGSPIQVALLQPSQVAAAVGDWSPIQQEEAIFRGWKMAVGTEVRSAAEANPKTSPEKPQLGHEMVVFLIQSGWPDAFDESMVFLRRFNLRD